MTFSMVLTAPSADAEPDDDAEPSHDDFDSVVMDACNVLSRTDARFEVRGFGPDPWPVDVSYDLSTALEQLPDVLAGIRATKRVTLDFYGQGMGRELVFTPQRDDTEIVCVSRTSWEPDPATERMTSTELERMLVRLAMTFAESVSRVAPRFAVVAPLSRWRTGDL
ncbi:hypothetical protein ACFY4C_42245 [Actinomadura viridis]|uniref:hypothetical protein n=1 Tax=Actinomadura viridis TaxID=58110 RepID=UPI003683A7C0